MIDATVRLLRGAASESSTPKGVDRPRNRAYGWCAARAALLQSPRCGLSIGSRNAPAAQRTAPAAQKGEKLSVPNKPASRCARFVPWAVAIGLALTLASVSASSAATFAVAGARDATSPIVPQSLLDAASAQPTALFRVVVHGGDGTRSAA